MPGIADFGAQFLRHLGRPAFARIAHHHPYKEVARVRLPQPGRMSSILLVIVVPKPMPVLIARTKTPKVNPVRVRRRNN